MNDKMLFIMYNTEEIKTQSINNELEFVYFLQDNNIDMGSFRWNNIDEFNVDEFSEHVNKFVSCTIIVFPDDDDNDEFIF